MLYDNLFIYFNQVGEHQPLTEEEEDVLIEKLSKGCEKSKERLILSQLLFVIKIAGSMGGGAQNYEDLIAEGNTGLIEAVDKYDPKFKARFSTYARIWIYQRMYAFLNQKASMIRLPSRMNQEIRKMNKEISHFKGLTGREPDDEELAEIMHLKECKIKSLKRNCLLTEDFFADFSSEFNETAAGDTYNPLLIVESNDLKEKLLLILEELDGVEARIIYLRYFEGYSIEEIAKKLSVKPYFVRKSEEKSLKKMKTYFEAKKDAFAITR